MEQCKWQGQIYAVKLYSHFATNQCRERKISCQTQHLYSVVSNSLQPHWLYSPWNSPDQNTRVGSLSLLQKIFATQDQTQVSRIAGGFFTSWATGEVQEYWVGILSLLQQTFPTQESSQGLLHGRGGFFTNWAMGEACQSAVGDAESQITGARFRRNASQLRSCCGFVWCSFGALASNASTEWQWSFKKCNQRPPLTSASKRGSW